MRGYPTKGFMKRVKILKQDHIPPVMSGVYFIIRKRTKRIEYIGMSCNIIARVYGNYIYMDNPDKYIVRYMPCDFSKARWYERRWMQKYRPRYNIRIPTKHTNYLHNPYRS